MTAVAVFLLMVAAYILAAIIGDIKDCDDDPGWVAEIRMQDDPDSQRIGPLLAERASVML